MTNTELKVLGAIILLSKKEEYTPMQLKQISDKLNYKTSGGAISLAIKLLEMKNYISVQRQGDKKTKIKVMVLI